MKFYEFGKDLEAAVTSPKDIAEKIASVCDGGSIGYVNKIKNFNGFSVMFSVQSSAESLHRFVIACHSPEHAVVHTSFVDLAAEILIRVPSKVEGRGTLVAKLNDVVAEALHAEGAATLAALNL